MFAVLCCGILILLTEFLLIEAKREKHAQHSRAVAAAGQQGSGAAEQAQQAAPAEKMHIYHLTRRFQSLYYALTPNLRLLFGGKQKQMLLFVDSPPRKAPINQTMSSFAALSYPTYVDVGFVMNQFILRYCLLPQASATGGFTPSPLDNNIQWQNALQSFQRDKLTYCQQLADVIVRLLELLKESY